MANPTAQNHSQCAGDLMTGANLSGQNLSFANLSRANLSRREPLQREPLRREPLRRQPRAGQPLWRQSVQRQPDRGQPGRSNLTNANLSKAALQGANLGGAHLAGASLSGATTTGANIPSSDSCATVLPNGSVSSTGCSIKVSPAIATVANGLTTAFSATGQFAGGFSVPLNQNLTWSTSNSQVATVSPAGVATGVAADPTPTSFASKMVTIAAKAGRISGSATLTVGPPNLTSLSVSPSGSDIVAGTSEQLTATGSYSDSATENLSSVVNWSSSNTAAATVVPGGVVTGVAKGSSVLTASTGSVSNSATVTVVSQLAIDTTSLPPVVLGTSYSQTLAAVGGTGAYTWSLTSGDSLPPGLHLSSAGVISGMPTASGTSTFTVQVADPGPPVQTVTSTLLTIGVVPTLTAPAPTTLPAVVQESSYSQQVPAPQGGTGSYTYSLASGTLPPGLNSARTGPSRARRPPPAPMTSRCRSPTPGPRPRPSPSPSRSP